MEEMDNIYMRQALFEAQLALEQGEVPIGAVIIDQYGNLIGQGHNQVEQIKYQGDHAEACAIRSATKYLKTWRLTGCALYVTLEPCMMCISLAALSRIERIVYGAPSPRFGYSLDKEGILRVYTRQIKSITSGVLADEAAQLLKNGFGHSRKKNDREPRSH